MMPFDPSKLKPSLGGKLGFGEVSVRSEDGLCMKIAKEPYCQLCKKSFVTRDLYDSHLNGTAHKENIAKLASAPPSLSGGGLPPVLAQHIAALLEPVQPRAT